MSLLSQKGLVTKFYIILNYTLQESRSSKRRGSCCRMGGGWGGWGIGVDTSLTMAHDPFIWVRGPGWWLILLWSMDCHVLDPRWRRRHRSVDSAGGHRFTGPTCGCDRGGIIRGLHPYATNKHYLGCLCIAIVVYGWSWSSCVQTVFL